ncbi:MAG: DUF4397 domain-containing protein [Clostridium sp.]|jgi:Domain of unknown function (DUF4397)|uniref:DUF4397 domain-containing protein n=1 Tax=Clostridium TaxID=1485 RepID=UPI00241FBEA2|nr:MULTISPECIES: DUF4397 domain-containing protein [Clostridium]MBS6503547.1 DUF4397 domain-containing protein [Clostridium sp.]MDU1568929.1 DUF4397 domain-containing protein [Clostridium sp.]MDU2461575.1 DUF4397 domain-containing protein [Clostridium sp.]
MLFRQNLPNLQSKIRFLHAIPSSPAVDIYLDGSLFVKDSPFSNISCYESVAPGTHELQLYITGTYDTPLFTRNIDILPDTSLTVNIVTSGGGINILVLNDVNVKGNMTLSFLRFINLSSNAPLMSLSLPNNIVLFDNVEYLETTGYLPLSPGIYNLKVTFSAIAGLEKYINERRLQNGRYYTIYIIGLLNRQPQIGYIMVEDGRD